MEEEVVVEETTLEVGGNDQKMRIRIVGHGEEDPSQFMLHKDNWRIHPDSQAAALGGLLSEVGFVQAVIVNLRTSPEWGAERYVKTLIDGHLRVALAKKHGEAKVPVAYVDLNQSEERTVLATFDPVGELAVPDQVKLDEILVDVQVRDASLVKLIDKLGGEGGNTQLDLGVPTPLPDVDIEGVSTERIRCIIVFEDMSELNDFYQRFNRQPDTSKILWRYSDLSEVSETDVAPDES